MIVVFGAINADLSFAMQELPAPGQTLPAPSVRGPAAQWQSPPVWECPVGPHRTRGTDRLQASEAVAICARGRLASLTQERRTGSGSRVASR